VVALRQGNHLKAQEIVTALPIGMRASLLAEFTEVLAEAEGWFGQWCHDAVSLLHLTDPGEDVRHRVAENPSTPAAVLTQLATYSEEYVQGRVDVNSVLMAIAKAVKADPTWNGPAIGLLAGNKSAHVREAIASEQDLPANLLVKLSNDRNKDVRIAIASNGATPLEVLVTLCGDKSVEVVQATAGNLMTPPNELIALASHRSEEVVEAVASNSATPPDTLAEFLLHGSERVKTAAANNPSTPLASLRSFITSREIEFAATLDSLAQAHQDDEFIGLLARRLLWVQLAEHGAAAQLVLQHGYRTVDGVELTFFYPHQGNLAKWTVFLCDDSCGCSSYDDSTILRDGFAGHWPGKPSWDEFVFGRAWSHIGDLMDDYAFEELSDSEFARDGWPSLVVGTGYAYGALVDLAERGMVDDGAFVWFHANIDGAESFGSVEIMAAGATSIDGALPPIPCASDSVIAVLSRFRLKKSKGEELARDLIEPLLAITPGVSSEILDFIVSDPTCPAMNLVSTNSTFPDEIRALAVLSNIDPLPDGFDLYLEASSLEEQGSFPRQVRIAPPAGLLLEESADEARLLRGNIASLLVAIMKTVAHPDEYAEDATLEASVGRHKDFIQARMWLLGTISAPESMIGDWIEALTALKDSLMEEDDDSELVEQLAFDSWKGLASQRESRGAVWVDSNEALLNVSDSDTRRRLAWFS
jgi:hypothetical protein